MSVVIGETLIKSSSLQSLYRQMVLIRRAEERLQKLFADGDVPGFLHLSIGQEAVAVGISSVLGVADTVSSNHRGHGHAIAKGVSRPCFFAEITPFFELSIRILCQNVISVSYTHLTLPTKA